jgi:hypothetical protein
MVYRLLVPDNEKEVVLDMFILPETDLEYENSSNLYQGIIRPAKGE